LSLTHDVYSETNPAFCAYVIAAFVTAFSSTRSEGPELVSTYVSIPIALSGELESAFEGTNRNTGLIEWLERSPAVQIGLTSRINESLSIVTEGVRFACFAGVISLDASSRLRLGSNKLKEGPQKVLSVQPKNAIKRATRLGYWFAAEGSSRSTFESLGLTV
jgi:hypothetical protein